MAHLERQDEPVVLDFFWSLYKVRMNNCSGEFKELFMTNPQASSIQQKIHGSIDRTQFFRFLT